MKNSSAQKTKKKRKKPHSAEVDRSEWSVVSFHVWRDAVSNLYHVCQIFGRDGINVCNNYRVPAQLVEPNIPGF